MSNLSDTISQIASFSDYSLNKAFISATVLCDIYCMGILPALLISVKKIFNCITKTGTTLSV